MIVVKFIFLLTYKITIKLITKHIKYLILQKYYHFITMDITKFTLSFSNPVLPDLKQERKVINSKQMQCTIPDPAPPNHMKWKPWKQFNPWRISTLNSEDPATIPSHLFKFFRLVSAGSCRSLCVEGNFTSNRPIGNWVNPIEWSIGVLRFFLIKMQKYGGCSVN